MTDTNHNEERPPFSPASPAHADTIEPPRPDHSPEAGPQPATVPEAETDAPVRVQVSETQPPATRTRPTATTPARRNFVWIIFPVVVLLALAVLILIRSRSVVPKTGKAAAPQVEQAQPDLSNYSAFVAKNRALLEQPATQVLNDEAFAGRSPLAVGPNGPLVSSEIDPQLAALADALKVRVGIMGGSQVLAKGGDVTRQVRGDFRGFKVQAFERLVNGRVVSEETAIVTPKGGVFRTSGRILAALQRIDHAGLLAELRAAGMEFTSLPGREDCHGQLRLLSYWGKPIAAERLISGAGVGGVSLGMPLSRLKSRIAAGDSILRRKVLINDVYQDVYKVMDQGGNPLFFVYERDGKVLGIWVVSESFKTGMGVGINDPLDKIRIHYPAVTFSRTRENTPFVRVEGVAGMLILQDEGDKRVVAILIGDSPEFG
jgi:hypothetical protein